MILGRTSPRYVNQRNFVLTMAGILFLAIAGFFIYQFKFLRPPRIELLTPTQDIATQSRVFDIRGFTDPDSDLTLNGRPLYIRETGEFSERIYLFRGVNRIVLEAKNRYGKMTELIRHIVVR